MKFSSSFLYRNFQNFVINYVEQQQRVAVLLHLPDVFVFKYSGVGLKVEWRHNILGQAPLFILFKYIRVLYSLFGEKKIDAINSQNKMVFKIHLKDKIKMFR